MVIARAVCHWTEGADAEAFSERSLDTEASPSSSTYMSYPATFSPHLGLSLWPPRLWWPWVLAPSLGCFRTVPGTAI